VVPKTRRKPVTTSDLIAKRLLYPVAEAAILLGAHRTTLYARAREGRLELLRVGGRTYVTGAELERYVREETEPAHLEDRPAS
jgi:excisionase family DNA binding protein